jgi:hypothetical protein
VRRVKGLGRGTAARMGIAPAEGAPAGLHDCPVPTAASHGADKPVEAAASRAFRGQTASSGELSSAAGTTPSPVAAAAAQPSDETKREGTETSAASQSSVQTSQPSPSRAHSVKPPKRAKVKRNPFTSTLHPAPPVSLAGVPGYCPRSPTPLRGEPSSATSGFSWGRHSPDGAQDAYESNASSGRLSAGTHVPLFLHSART